MATLEEVEKATQKYYEDGDVMASNVFGTKYALTDPSGDILELTPEDMHRRLSREFARVEANYPNPMSEQEIFSYLDRFKYIIPQGSPMSGIGNPYQIQSISNCFVIESPYDSYGGILKTDQELVQIAKRRGGIGFDISTIRPKGMPTSNAAKTTDGIEVFMDRFSNSCREVAQNGRRGALMLSISVHHPQILDFVRIKKNLGRVTGANISIRLTDEFLSAVENKSDYETRFPVDALNDDGLFVPPQVTKSISATEVWDEIMLSAWESAEPGLLFWDNIIKNSPADIYSKFGFKTLSTNPCGELPLPAGDSCRLLLLNLVSFVKNPFTDSAEFDFQFFSEMTQKAQRLMDDMIDLEIEQIDKILAKIDADNEPEEVKAIEKRLWQIVREKALVGRRTGLGVTGVGDTVASLNLRYGSDDSIDAIEKIYKTLAINAYKSSSIMAKERGAFKIHDHSLEEGHPYLSRLWEADPELYELSKTHGRRNIALLTTAPAGSVSVEAQVSSGIEPTYLVKYRRRKKINQSEDIEPDFVDQNGDKWIEFDVFHHGFKKWMDVTGKTEDDIEESPYWKATANDIDWVQKIKLQAAAQKWVDHSISNTTNIPADASVDTVKKIYESGWKTGCKGVTIYRDGSRTGVLVSAETTNTEKFEDRSAPKRPDELQCDIHQGTIKDESWTILVGLMDGKPYEIMGGQSKFIEIPKKYERGVLVKRPRKTMPSKYDLIIGEGDDEFKVKDIVTAFENPNFSGFTRTISLALRHGAPTQYVVEQLQKDKDMDLFSFAKVISRVLKKYVADGLKPSGNKDCPDCGSLDSLVYIEGCVTCTSCASSKCG